MKIDLLLSFITVMALYPMVPNQSCRMSMRSQDNNKKLVKDDVVKSQRRLNYLTYSQVVYQGAVSSFQNSVSPSFTVRDREQRKIKHIRHKKKAPGSKQMTVEKLLCVYVYLKIEM